MSDEKKITQKFCFPELMKEDFLPIPRDIHTVARKSLIKMFKDSLSFNDAKELPEEAHASIEDDIVNDFQNIADYISYLLLRLSQKGIKLSE